MLNFTPIHIQYSIFLGNILSFTYIHHNSLHKQHNWTQCTGKYNTPLFIYENGQKILQHLHLHLFVLHKNRNQA